MKTWKALTIALSIALIGAQAQQRRDPQEYIKLLESERRVENLQIDRVVDTLKIKSGQHVADIGAGSGLFTRPIAKKTGETGTVYAIDIDPDLLKHIEKTARDEKLSNVRTIMAAEDDPRIPEPVDLILLVDTLHHIKGQGAYLKSLRRYLRPSGRIAVIDFSESWPAGHEQMKYTLADLEKWMKGAGFQQVEKHDFLNNNFFVVYH
jgi:cyclopropane fatty-acyl-phospholipid synthase-like methyltransferase